MLSDQFRKLKPKGDEYLTPSSSYEITRLQTLAFLTHIYYVFDILENKINLPCHLSVVNANYPCVFDKNYSLP
jgi:hypothetical protein